MALIKCSECGNEISDRATHCVYCGCPIEELIKHHCEECGKEISKNDKICPSCGCPVILKDDKSVIKKEKVKDEIKDSCYYDIEFELDKIMVNLEKVDSYKKKFLILAIIFTILIVTIPSAIYFWIYYFFLKGCQDNDLRLTNKRIKGKIKRFGSITNVDIPLDKIDSIISEQSIFKIDRVEIRSGSCVRGVLFTVNGEEFCKKTTEEIEKYKKYMYSKIFKN